MRTFAAILALFFASAAAAPAQPAQRCARDSFQVGDQTVAVTTCAGADNGKTVAVTETFKGRSASFNHTTAIEVLPGASASRAVDDVSLTPLGLPYTLHLTLAHRDGAVAIEHALLLPGAVPLK
jgi:hypothetical protein